MVVGAGLAGLTAAHRIRLRTGWPVAVHEATARIGGRAYTVRDLPGGLHCEAGGAFISTGDAAIRSLARELHVPLLDLDPVWPDGAQAYYFDGRRRTRDRVHRGAAAAERVAERAFRTIPWPIRHGTHDPDVVRLDRMTVAEWIGRHVPDSDATYRSFLTTYVETEYGGPADEASALHLVADFAAPGRSYDERFVVRDGTDTLTEVLARRLPDGALHRSSALVAVRRRPHGYRLTFDSPGGRHDVHADAVVLALPFPALADVDLTHAGFSPLKRRAIRLLGMGVGQKANLVFDSAPWRPGSGDSVSDLGTGETWPGHPGQHADARLMVCLTGRAALPAPAGSPVHGPATAPLVDAYLTDLERLFPGSAAAYAGVTRVDRWAHDPWIGGTYSYYRAGTFTEIAGAERTPQRRAFFAGEHTAGYGNRGTLNGAVASGERAAREAIAALR